MAFGIKNKTLDDGGSKLFGFFENDDRPISREQLELTRSKLVGDAARERDLNKKNEMIVQIGKIDLAIKNFDAIHAAELEVSFATLNYLSEQRKTAAREANEFDEQCCFIASQMIQRYMGINPLTTNLGLYEGDLEMRVYRRAFKPYAAEIFKTMSTDQVRQQYDEIFRALNEGRVDWEELSFTPKPPKIVINAKRKWDHELAVQREVTIARNSPAV